MKPYKPGILDEMAKEHKMTREEYFEHSKTCLACGVLHAVEGTLAEHFNKKGEYPSLERVGEILVSLAAHYTIQHATSPAEANELLGNLVTELASKNAEVQSNLLTKEAVRQLFSGSQVTELSFEELRNMLFGKPSSDRNN